MIQKTFSIKRKIDRSDSIKRVRIQATEWEEIFAVCISGSKHYPEYV